MTDPVEAIAEALLLDRGVTDDRAEGVMSDDDYEQAREKAVQDASLPWTI